GIMRTLLGQNAATDIQPIMKQRTKRWRGLIFLQITIAVAVSPLYSQQYTRTELGVEASFVPNTRSSSANDAGLGARFVWNLSNALAMESEFDSYQTNIHSAQRSLQFGGRATMGVFGSKAGIRRQGYGVFFKARPGVLSFGSALASSSVFGSLTTKRITHAVLDLGVVSELYPSSTTVLRVDVSTLL